MLLGIFGIICAILLFLDLNKKRSEKIIWWICLQGLLIFHQFFFMFEIVFIALEHFQHNVLITTGIALALGVHFVYEFYSLVFIINLYQQFVESEASESRPQRPWRVPTISELLSDQAAMGQSTPPAHVIRNSSGTSEA